MPDENAPAPSAPAEPAATVAPPDDNSSGGAPTPTGAPSPSSTGLLEGADTTTPAPDPATEVGTPHEMDITDDIPITEKPSYIPQQFWDKQTGTPKDQAFYKSYTDLRRELGQMRNAKDNFKAPETADEYLKDYIPPHRIRPIGEQKEGEVMDRFGDLDAQDPVFIAVAKAAKNVNMSKGQFDDFMQGVMEDIHPMLPEVFNAEKEMSKLGESGKMMIQTNSNWIANLKKSGMLNEDQHHHMLSMGATALGVEVVNILRLNSGEKPIPVTTSVNTGIKTPAECEAMLADPLYKDDGPAGEAYRAEVEQAFIQTHGTAK